MGPPRFSQMVVSDGEAADCLRPLHEMMMGVPRESGREERLLRLASLLLRRYGRPAGRPVPGCPEGVGNACRFVERHYARRVSLNQVCRRAGFSKSALLRAFVKAKGVMPYRYPENIRISEAGKLLRQGCNLRRRRGGPAFSARSISPTVSAGLSACLPALMGGSSRIRRDRPMGSNRAVGASLYMHMIPVITGMASVMILYERITPLSGAGTVLTLAGLLLSEDKLFFRKGDTQHGPAK